MINAVFLFTMAFHAYLCGICHCFWIVYKFDKGILQSLISQVLPSVARFARRLCSHRITPVTYKTGQASPVRKTRIDRSHAPAWERRVNRSGGS